MTDYQQKLAQQYNRDVKTREFGASDLMLQNTMGSERDINAEKLAPNWEEPYRIIAIAGARAYYLEDMEERPLLRP